MADCFVKYIYQYKLSLAIVIVKIKSLFKQSAIGYMEVNGFSKQILLFLIS